MTIEDEIIDYLNAKQDVIFIPSNVPSSKNSRITNRKTGMSFPSPTTQKYYRATKDAYIALKSKFKEIVKDYPKPYDIGFFFIRSTRRKFDYANPINTVQDRMVKFNWIDDDNCLEIAPFVPRVMGKRYIVSKEHSGVYIIPKRYDL